jgi:hypothetical protein
MTAIDPTRRPGVQRVPTRGPFTLFELVSAVHAIADSEEEALAIVLDVLDSEPLRFSKGVPGRPLHRF